MEMQLVMAQVAATAEVASEASTRTTLEAVKQSADDSATAAQSSAAAAVTERDELASRLALAKAEVEKLRAAATPAKEAAERAKAAAAAIEAAAQAAAREKAALETKVANLERDLGTAMADLEMAGRQFSQDSNQLQEVSKEATRLHESNAKLSEDLEGESSRCFPSPSPSLPASWRLLICLLLFQGCACIMLG
jgi:chromosome segregation ATPase